MVVQTKRKKMVYQLIMTSKNYDAAAVCEGTVKPPAFGLAIGGAAVQLAGLYALWGVPDPSTAFGAAYVTTVVLSACVWVLSIVKGGRSTPAERKTE